MNAKEQLGSFKKLLDVELDKFLSGKAERANKIAPEASELIEHIKDFTLRGGKRIRAALLFYSYLAHGGKNKPEGLQASMGMEMSETYLLIHDDIIDNDSLRRGGITPHTSYEQIYKKRFPGRHIDPKHFGTSMAILAGDLACAYMNELIVGTEFKKENKARAIQELSYILEREVFGETLDIVIELKDNPTKEDVTLVQQLKTAPYTFDSPMKLGAILAGANEKQIKILESYTVPLGTAFQIQDDILGMFGSEDKIGKPVISDLREGKITLLILDALEKANPVQEKKIRSCLGNKNVTKLDLEEVKQIIIDTGALDKSKNLAIQLANNAKQGLQDLKLKKEGKDFLLGIAQYMVNREY